MSSRLYKQFLFSDNPMLTFVEGSFKVGATGAVATSAVLGTGVTSVTRLTTGLYQLRLSDNFNRMVGFHADTIAPTSAAGSAVDGSFLVNAAYMIVNPSTSTNWQTVGLPTGLTAALGMPFVASSGASAGATGGVPGTGRAIRIIASNVARIDLLPNPNTELAPLPTQGAYLHFQTLDYAGALVDPTSTTTIRFNVFLRNSSLKGTGEQGTPNVPAYKLY